MKALTLRPHWAWLIVNGYKDIENRSWRTRRRGRIWIHAGSRSATKVEYENFLIICRERRIKRFPQRQEFKTGGIVGSVNIVDCVTDSRSYWFGGDYGFVLENPRKTPFRLMKGRLGFFEVETATRSHLGLTAKSRNSTMSTDDFVAYHSTALMGYEYDPTKGPFRFYSRKSRTFLEKSIGCNVWAITGTRDSNHTMIYRLAAVYTPDQVRGSTDAFQIVGKRGYVFKKTVELNGLPWFPVLLCEQNRFSFGFSRIHNPGVIKALHRLRQTQYMSHYVFLYRDKSGRLDPSDMVRAKKLRPHQSSAGV
jgi:hypothetical protein